MYLFDVQMDTRGYVKCFECEKLLHESIYKENMACYSHLLEKAKYPQYAGDVQNVVIVCPDCHTLYTLRPRKATKQYERFLILKQIYNL